MNLSNRVLPKHIEAARKLTSFVNHCVKQQKYALAANDELTFYWWVKEGRRARRELAEMYREKEIHDQEKEKDYKSISGIIQRLQSQGINASAVERAHYITLEGG
ncbi:hypothetical protein CON65_02575 [Bacillus pseudomycoides]|uniref:Uncharacterized protein n=1 Tax=Bacillus pseudomycoides TaxID=64104 RepID=A0AA91VG14_9BACI|nr:MULTISPECIES: hypothetical protein [Bacillus]PED84336.1 hypothetical protein CON65_02575 [Bacillus pseudomycoides]PEU08675.1 hypothetical protein CN525_25675 [Bacillus sp. AFS014408]PEU15863.1 hypothetical protein CN524_06280 [Bacillus sp. AFS019443]PFW64837.1 hypothetical protein COL20_02280 [Bacillus sp. AFS075034]